MSAHAPLEKLPCGGREGLRWWFAPLLALFLTLLMVWVMRWMIRAPQEAVVVETPGLDSVRLVDIDRSPPPPAPQLAASTPPPPPPPAPPSVARADLPAIAAPEVSLAPSTVQIPLGNGASSLVEGLGLGSSGVFGGFTGGAGLGGGGGGGAGYATGQGFKGKELIPLSTARPQMPDWACKQQIKGWVTAVFIVMPDGHVRDVRIVDAQPRGVYEAAAIESISHWIYEQSDGPREVLQEVEMDPADCQYNWR